MGYLRIIFTDDFDGKSEIGNVPKRRAQKSTLFRRFCDIQRFQNWLQHFKPPKIYPLAIFIHDRCTVRLAFKDDVEVTLSPSWAKTSVCQIAGLSAIPRNFPNFTRKVYLLLRYEIDHLNISKMKSLMK